MISLLFDCSAFEISATVQVINDILFPVVLYAVIFWLMCNIFLTDVASNSPKISYESNLGIAKSLDNYATTEIFSINDELLANQKCGISSIV